MGQNQHYVPQFLFRRFSENLRTIGLLLRNSGKIVDAAPFDSQCAADNFYGSEQLESLLSALENRHAGAIKVFADLAWGIADSEFEPLNLAHFWEAVVLQRFRTSLEVKKHVESQSTFLMEAFRRHIETAPDINNRANLIKAIDNGGMRLIPNEPILAAENVQAAVEFTLLISDLELCILRNQTDYPFIFSDSPVVFFNDYCRNVRNRGVLGLQCPGLQIVFPLDSITCAFMYDPEKYEGSIQSSEVLDLVNRGDVSQLNALQLHHSLNAVYFGSPTHRAYVSDLWATHHKKLSTLRSEIDLNSNLFVDGKPPEGQLIHSFEPQIDFELSLSFIHSNRISEAEYTFAARSPELRRDVMRQSEARFAKRKNKRSKKN